MYCPYCGLQKTNQMSMDWLVVATEDSSNVDILQEWECQDCSRSFWPSSETPDELVRQRKYYAQLLTRATPILALLIDWWMGEELGKAKRGTL